MDSDKLYSLEIMWKFILLLITGSSVLSCAPQPEGSKGGNPLISLLPIILIFVVFYLLLIYPKQREQKKRMEMLSKLKKGDEVITSAGIHGRVVGVMDGIVVLKIAENVKIEVEKSHITTIIKK